MTRPLLSRRQLSLLILLLPGLILLLTLIGPGPAPTPWQASPDQRVYWQSQERADYRLHLLLPQPPAHSASEQLQQRLLLAALQQQLNRTAPRWHALLGAQPQLRSRPGLLMLELQTGSAPGSDQLAQLLAALRQPAGLDWHALLQRVQAEQYLHRQQPEDWLASQFPAASEPLRSLDPADAYYRWLAPERWQLTLSGPAPQPLSLPATGEATPQRPGTMLSLRPLPVPEPSTATSLQLHRWPLPRLASVDQLALSLLAREAVQQPLSAALAQRLQAQRSGGFSLQWVATLPRGRASLVLQGDDWPELRTWLPAQLATADLAAARQAVQAQLQQPGQQQAWIDLLALHRLPADSLERLPAALEAIDTDELQHWLQQQLESDYYHTLSLPASP